MLSVDIDISDIRLDVAGLDDELAFRLWPWLSDAFRVGFPVPPSLAARSAFLLALSAPLETSEGRCEDDLSSLNLLDAEVELEVRCERRYRL